MVQKRRNGRSVRTVRYASGTPNSTDRPVTPAIRSKLLRMISAVPHRNRRSVARWVSTVTASMNSHDIGNTSATAMNAHRSANPSGNSPVKRSRSPAISLIVRPFVSRRT
jgi:hypothetical protein